MTGAADELVHQGAGLDAARLDLLLTHLDLWYAYFAVGGELAYDAMRRYLSGAATATRREHNRLVLVLNEQFLDLYSNHPVPYLA